MDYSRKVIFSILAVALLGSISLAYAGSLDFILSFEGDEFGSGTAFISTDGIAVNSTNFIIVGESSGGANNVQIFDSTGLFIRALSGGSIANPSFIAVNSTNFIIVGNSGGTPDTVEIYDKGGFFIRALDGAGAFTNLRGVAVNSTGFIFAMDVNDLEIYDKGGFFLKSVTGTDLGGSNFLSTSEITVDSNDRLLVFSDNDPGSLQIFDGNEQFVLSFTGRSDGIVWEDVEAIATDASNNIFVSERNTTPDTIEIYDSTGVFLTVFDGTNGGGAAFTTIRSITVDSNGRILVSDSGQTPDIVQIYEGFSVPTTPTKSGGGGESEGAHKTRPTFGLDHNTLRQLIEGGFSFNGKSHDITDNWWTPFAEQKVKVGSTNSFTAKVFAYKQLRVQEFLFGIPAVGEAHKAELGIEIVYDYSREIDRINVVQKTGIIDIDSIKVENTMSKCLSDDSDERCVTTHLSMKFLEPLQDKIMAIKAIDFKGRVHITYLNEGFDISGDSLNPMNTMMIVGTEKYEGLVEVTQTAKYSDIWTTQDDREFEMNEYGSFKQINQIFENDSNLMDKRFSSDFADYKKSLADKYAKLLLESCPNCFTSFADFDDSFAYSGINYDLSSKERIDRISHLIEIEKQKAIQVLIDAELAITYPDYIIDTDDRPISVILAEERYMKKILADERAYLKQVLAPQQ